MHVKEVDCKSFLVGSTVSASSALICYPWGSQNKYAIYATFITLRYNLLDSIIFYAIREVKGTDGNQHPNIKMLGKNFSFNIKQFINHAAIKLALLI